MQGHRQFTYIKGTLTSNGCHIDDCGLLTSIQESWDEPPIEQWNGETIDRDQFANFLFGELMERGEHINPDIIDEDRHIQIPQLN